MSAVSKLEFVYGGSFDPVHLGHQNIVTHLNAHFSEASVRILPCSQPALKAPNVASFEQRLAMLEIAFDGNKNVIIDPRENYRRGKSYTFHSLTEIREEDKESSFVLVVGTDTFQTMDKWFRFEELSKLCNLLLVARPGVIEKNSNTLIKKLGFLPAKTKGELAKQAVGLYYCLPIEEKNISSSQIRSQIESSRLDSRLLSKEITTYIRDNGLYSSGFISSQN